MFQYILITEMAGYVVRYVNRMTQYRKALKRARQIGRPLFIFGAPDRGPTGTFVPAPYGCGQPEYGDKVLDFGFSRCSNYVPCDLRHGLSGVPTNSVVVFESCVLEYIQGDGVNLKAISNEMFRISGGEVFAVRVERWCPVTHMVTGSNLFA